MKRFICLLIALLIPMHALAEPLPVLVSIGIASGTVKVNNRNVTAAGVGKRAPWGIHEADVIYESLMYQTGQTRLACLFLSSFPDAVGPVRSARIHQYYLREEWQAALVFNGDTNYAVWDVPEVHALTRSSDLILNNHKNKLIRQYTTREKGVKAPDNLSVNLAGLQAALRQREKTMQSPLVFADAYSGIAGVHAAEIALDWGSEAYLTRLIYDQASGCYLRYNGKVPMLSYASAQKQEQPVQLAFRNIIVQHVPYEWLAKTMPVLTGIGSGKADFFIDGMHVEGSWVRESRSAPTRYLDSRGEEMTFPHGKTYIAQFPADHQASFNEDGMALYTHHP